MPLSRQSALENDEQERAHNSTLLQTAALISNMIGLLDGIAVSTGYVMSHAACGKQMLWSLRLLTASMSAAATTLSRCRYLLLITVHHIRVLALDKEFRLTLGRRLLKALLQLTND